MNSTETEESLKVKNSSFISVSMCERCEERVQMILCKSCSNQRICEHCSVQLHQKHENRNHKPMPLNSEHEDVRNYLALPEEELSDLEMKTIALDKMSSNDVRKWFEHMNLFIPARNAQCQEITGEILANFEKNDFLNIGVTGNRQWEEVLEQFKKLGIQGYKKVSHNKKKKGKAKILMKGCLEKQNLNNTFSWKQRWCILEGNKLVWFSDKSYVKRKGSIKIINARIIENLSKSDLEFQIETSYPTRKHVFQATGKTDKSKWMSALSAVTSSLKHDLKTKCSMYDDEDDYQLMSFLSKFQLKGTPNTWLLKNKSIGYYDCIIIREFLSSSNNGLQCLNLEGNNIGDKETTLIGDSLKQNSELKELNLKLNNIGNFGAQQLAEGLKVNSTLYILSLNSNVIEPIGAGAIAASLKINSSLQKLHFDKNKIGDSGAHEFGKCLKDNKKLEELSLGWNNVGNKGAKGIIDGLKDNDTLTSLSLRNNPDICEEFARELAAVVMKKKTLQEFSGIPKNRMIRNDASIWKGDLGTAGFSDVEALLLASIFKINTVLRHVDLRDNYDIGGNAAKMVAMAVCEKGAIKLFSGIPVVGLMDCEPTLTQLDLSSSKCSDAEAIILGLSLKHNSTLNKLNLWNNNIGNSGAQELGEALQTNNTLTWLDVRYNFRIDYDGASIFAMAVANSKTIEYFSDIPVFSIKANQDLGIIDLNNVGCGDTEVLLVMELLKNNPQTKSYDFRHNSNISKRILKEIGDVIMEDEKMGIFSGIEISKIKMNDPSITELDLSSSGCSDLEATILGHLLEMPSPDSNVNTTLTKLNLRNNLINDHGAEELGERLRMNTVLKSLDIRKNYGIGPDGAKTLATTVFKSQTLEIFSGIPVLKIKNNDPTITNLVLSSGCSDTEAMVLSLIISSMNTEHTELKSLDINEATHIGDICAKALAQSLIERQTIEKLSKIPLLNIKTNDQKITELILPYSQLSDTEAIVLGEILKGNNLLTKLNLSENRIADLGAHSIAEGMISNSSLTSLDVSYNNISDVGGQEFGKSLEENNSLTQLILNNNHIGDVGCKCLANGLKKNSILKELHLMDNEIKDNGAQYLAQALEKNSALITLVLRGNQIADIGLEFLGNSLKNNRVLTSLELRDNPSISEDAADAFAVIILEMQIIKNFSDISIARVRENDSSISKLDRTSHGCPISAIILILILPNNNTLTELKLDDNRIGNIAAQRIGDLLKDNSTLTDLMLNKNCINDVGCHEISDGLKKNYTLKRLELNDNRIGDNGARSLGDALESNNTLMTLFLCNNVIEDPGAQYIGKGLEQNSTIQEIYLYQNKIGPNGKFTLRRITNKHQSVKVLCLEDRWH